MSEAHKVVYLLRRAPKDDIIVMLLCMSLTVLFDMVIAITVGIVLASLLFMRRIARMTRISEVSHDDTRGVLVLRVSGPLFFAAAERIFNEILAMGDKYQTVVMQWDAVPVLDAGGLNAFLRFVDTLPQGKRLMVTDMPFQPLKTLMRARVVPLEGRMAFFATLPDALRTLEEER